MKHFLFLSLSVFVLIAAAQKRKAFEVNAGQKITEAVPFAEICACSPFNDGAVYLKNKTYSPARRTCK